MTAASDWTGKVGDVWAREWRRTERSFADLEPLLRCAILDVAPRAGQFLDLGCGVGTTAAHVAAERVGATITGVDLSSAMIAIARERHHLPNLRFVAGEALEHVAPEAFDLTFSRHGVMFFADPRTAFIQLRRAMRPEAPLVFSCFRARRANAWMRELAAATDQSLDDDAGYVPGPFGFANMDDVRAMLSRSGWRVDAVEPVHFDYVAGVGERDDAAIADALTFFTRIGPAAAAIRAVSGDTRTALLERIGSRLARYAANGRVAMPAAAWICTARAVGEAA